MLLVYRFDGWLYFLCFPGNYAICVCAWVCVFMLNTKSGHIKSDHEQKSNALKNVWT